LALLSWRALLLLPLLLLLLRLIATTISTASLFLAFVVAVSAEPVCRIAVRVRIVRARIERKRPLVAV
jgi:hypothetical protein